MALKKLITEAVNSSGVGIDGLKEAVIPLVAVAATDTLYGFLARTDTYIESIYVLSETASPNWTIDVQNLGTTGAGTTSLLSGGAYDLNNLSALVAGSIGVNQNRVMAVGESLAFILTRTGDTLNGAIHIRYRASLGKGS